MKYEKEHMTEALARRRMGHAKPPMHANHGEEMPPHAEVEKENKGEGEIAPAGAMPPHDDKLGAVKITDPDNDGDMHLTPEMLMELLGSHNAKGSLRGRVMENAAAMAKKC